MEVPEDAENDAEPRGRADEKSGERRSRSSLSDARKTGKRKRPERFVVSELPSPPPDPTEAFPGGGGSGERRVSVADSASKAAVTALGVEAAFDHLDKLHSMIEEILEMRDRNGKLFRRVRELERAKATRKAHSEVERSVAMGQDPLLPDEDVGFAESLLGAMLASSYELAPRTSYPARSPPTPATTRITRSRSVGVEPRRVSCPVTADPRQQRERARNPLAGQRLVEIARKRPSLAVGTPKVSKWTRVKAAFKWERAACTANDAAALPAEAEASSGGSSARYLRIPENAGGSSEVSGPPTPAGTISSSSSIDDVFHRPHRPSSHQSTRITRRDENSDPSRRSRSLDGDASVPMTFVYSPRTRSKDNACLQGKSGDPRSHKTPWGKVKDMMQLRRDSLGRQPTRSGSRNEDAHSTSSIESSDIYRSELQQIDGRPPRVRITADSTPSLAIAGSPTKPGASLAANDFVDLATRRLTPTLTITVPSSEELRCISSPESITPPPPARQSFESGKSDRYSQAGYETPKETRTGQVSPASSSSGILRYGLGRSKTCQAVPFAGDFKRQQSLKGESLGSSPKMQRRDSKWNKVKRAFLTSATSVPTSPSRISSYFFDDGDATGGSYSASASAEDLDNDGASNPGAQAEIQRNYRLLHDKLGTEFYRKLAEWERLKTSGGGGSRDSPKFSAREKDGENLRLMGEERLTPEFKKKLEEWKRINKGSAGESRGSHSSEHRSVNRRRITDWQLWRSPSKPDNKPDSPRLSEDFVKKMEEWKRIKSAAARREAEVEEESQPRENPTEGQAEDDEEERRRIVTGVRLSEERRRAWKSLEDEEFRSLERVLEAMEMDRQTRLSKLQRIVGSPPQRTQEVLIHTSTGLYRFEGISRKFTRKLYEWEKSQGISPELSTFRLLDPLRYGVGSLRSRETPADSPGDGAPRRTLYRSKSVGSVQTNSWRTTREHEKPTIRRPSSLSLNDVDNLETRSCIVASSVPTIPDEEDTSEDIAMEDSEAEPEQEPEAVIVDIEDVIEETASPLRKYQPHQTPVYSVAGSETTSIAIPLGTVTARHEPSPVILIEPGEAHPLRARACSIDESTDAAVYAVASESAPEVVVSLPSTSNDQQQQQQQQQPRRSIAKGRRTRREAPGEDDDKLPRVDNVVGRSERTTVAAVAKKDGTKEPTFTCETASEESRVLPGPDKNWHSAMHPTHDCGPENLDRRATEEDETFEEAVITVRSNTRHSRRILKTRRLTDTQVGYDWRPSNLPSTSNDSEDPSSRAETENARAEREESVETSVSTSAGDLEDNPNVERIIINEETINKIVVPTASSSATISAALELDQENENRETISKKEKREPKSVFVKTKRIVFSPFRREGKKSTEESVVEPSKADKSPPATDSSSDSAKSNPASSSTSREANKSSCVSIASPEPSTSNANHMTASVQEIGTRSSEPKRPPLPSSPILARKEYRISSPKETAPGIRIMIRRYNEKLENETDRSLASGFSVAGVTSSANSSGSGSSSPSWRTPVLERRLLTRMERYDEAKKPVGSRGTCCGTCNASCDRTVGLAKSASADFYRQSSNLETGRERMDRCDASLRRAMERRSPSSRSDDLETSEANYDRGSSLSIRAMKIRRAKEDFLSRGPTKDGSPLERQPESGPVLEIRAKDNIEETKEETESSEDRRVAAARSVDLVKSASAGMINVDADTYERLQLAAAAAAATRMSDSLPRSNEHLRHPAASKETTSRFSQIARKFKRARLRRAKEKESGDMSTVSMLCRQSLLVDIASTVGDPSNGEAGTSKSNPATPGSSRKRGGHDRGDRLND